MSEYLEDHIKMKVLRVVAKEFPDGTIGAILKSLDKLYKKEFQGLQPPKKKCKFVTKF